MAGQYPNPAAFFGMAPPPNPAAMAYYYQQQAAAAVGGAQPAVSLIPSVTPARTGPPPNIMTMNTNGDEDEEGTSRYEEAPDPRNYVDMKVDSHYNMNVILSGNIVSSDYYRSLAEHKTFRDIMEEIQNEVKHLEPWVVGKNRLPSTAFCLLHKAFAIKFTKKQVHSMLTNRSNTLIRGMGFLFLRFACDPEKLWEWFEPYLDDEEKFAPGGDKTQTVTVGQFVKQLLSDINYYGTVLKRIPFKLQREIDVKLLEHSEAAASKAKSGAGKGKEVKGEDCELSAGMKVRAQYAEDGKFYDATIDKVLSGGRIHVTYTEYGNSEEVEASQILVDQSIAKMKKKSGDSDRRKRSSSRERSSRSSKKSSRDRSRSRSSGRSSRRRSRSRSRSSGRSSRSSRHSRRSRSRSRSRSRDRSSRSSRKSSRDRSRSRSSGRKSKRSRSRSRSRDRKDKDSERKKRRSSHSNSRSPSRSNGNDKDSSNGDGKKEMTLEEKVMQAARDRATVGSGQRYAQRPVSYKSALSLKMTSASTQRRSRSPQRSSRRSERSEASSTPSEPVASGPSVDHIAKMQALKAAYGDASSKSKPKSGGSAATKSSGARPSDSGGADVIRLG